MIKELLNAFILIFIAEMGDKTQILAMAFATKFSVKKVLMGIFIGCFLNHGLAVILGSYISSFIPMNTIQIVAGFAFVGFSLWTLKSDEGEDKDKEPKFKFGPVFTVALAFFIGELGDKTQLTAITLASGATYPLAILGGTVLGMIVTGGIGIIIGKKLGDKIPEFTIKIIAAAIFMFFGVSKLYRTLPSQHINLQTFFIFFAIISIIVFMLLKPMLARRQQGRESLLRRKSRELYNCYHQLEGNINKICLGTDTCGECQGNNCIVGYTKSLIKNGLEKNELQKQETFSPLGENFDKHYDKEQALEGLITTLTLLIKAPSNEGYENIHEIRKKLETLLFEKCIEHMDSWGEYKRILTEIDPNTATKIFEAMNR